MDLYCMEIRKLESRFHGIEYHHVVRDQNQTADQLSKVGSQRAAAPPGVFVQDLYTPSIKEADPTPEVLSAEQLVALLTQQDDDWRTLMIKYLSTSELQSDKIETEHLIRGSKNYVLVDGALMRKNSKQEILQKCITCDQGKQLLKEIHAGSCGNPAASRNLVDKAFQAGFY